MPHIPDDDQTLLDSRFGASRSEVEFKKMGLPDRRSRHWGKLGIAFVGLVGILAIQFSGGGGTSEAARLEGIESQLNQACKSSSWSQALATLAKLPHDHSAHASVPHLQVLEKAELECLARHWEKAYERLAEYPRDNPGLPVLADAVQHLRQRIAMEVQARDLIRHAADDLPSLKALVNRLDPTSIYRPEVVARLGQLESFILADHESRLELALKNADFEMADMILKSWSAQLPGHDATRWTRILNEAREACILRDRVHKDILGGQFIRAMGLMASAPDSELAGLKDGLEEAASCQEALTAACSSLAKGDFEHIEDIVDDLDDTNAVKRLFITRAEGLLQWRDNLHKALEEGQASRLKALRCVRTLIALGVPGEYTDRMVTLENELSLALSAWAAERQAVLRQAQDEGQYLVAYNVANELLDWEKAT
ncbi:MAG: hypothetical protein AB7F75_12760, partial [Planctomycetota bacterium]